MFSALQRLREFTLDLVLPHACSGCARNGAVICADCLNVLGALRSSAQCAHCHREWFDAEFCPDCRGRSSVERLFSIGPYAHPLLRQCIYDLKYGGIRELGSWLGVVLAKRLVGKLEAGTVVVPIPLHRYRFADRGFNQAEQIASAIARSLALPLLPQLLKRSVNTVTQVSLEHEQRQENVKGIFRAHPDVSMLEDRSVLIVDDVWTTGSTLREAAQTLKNAGVRRVMGAVVARGR